MGVSTYCSLKDLFRPAMGCLYLYLYLYYVFGTGLIPVLVFTFFKTNVTTQLLFCTD
jgi:hypothetical protein